MCASASEDWFERLWEYREETVYPKLFGAHCRGIFPISASVFLDMFKQESFDPRWLHYGVFEFAPTDTRPSWAYVTSGMSNPWEDEQPRRDGPSGMGCEFVFESSEQGEWAILRLQHLMAFQILLCCGKYLHKPPLGLYDRVPLHGPITPESSAIQRLMLVEPTSFPARIDLESGWVDFYSVVGITDDEAAFAREEGGDKLLEILRERGASPVTDPKRRSVVDATRSPDQ